MHPHQHGTLAQLVEQWTENPCVPGSNPGGTTKNPNRNIRVFYWLKFPNFHVSYLGETFATVFIALKINYPINFHQNIEFGSGRAVHYIFAATSNIFNFYQYLGSKGCHYHPSRKLRLTTILLINRRSHFQKPS